MMRTLFLTLLLAAGVSRAEPLIVPLDYARLEFSPARGESFAIPFELKQPARVEITLTGPDRHPVRTLKSEGVLKPGNHQLEWDGRDEEGGVVPDEAWVPVLTAIGKNGRETIDPWQESGGEVLDGLNPRLSAGGSIAYQLPAPARVLIRAGVEGGAMLATLANWEPRLAGRNAQRWDGFDADRLVDLRREPRLSLLVTAFTLPERAILTIGNDEIGYSEWHAEKGWEPFHLKPGTAPLERDGKRISPHHHLSRNLDRDPKVTLAFGGDPARTADGVPLITGKTPIKVDVPPEDRWLLDASLYEVAFFIDHQFVSEEEQGYLPLTWLWDPAVLEPGRHLLTVNISGFRGQVGVKSLLFEIPPRAHAATEGRGESDAR